MKQISFFIFLLMTGVLSCTEDYQLRTLQDSRILVVNGCITNEQGPYRIQLSESISNLSSNNNSAVSQPVTDARLVITDDLGNRDELKPLWKEKVVDVKVPYLYDEDTTHYVTISYMLMPNYANGYDSLRFVRSDFPDAYSDGFTFEKSVGTYYTTSIVGTPGRSYTLTIEYNDKTYTATDRMPYGTAIDSVVVKPIGKGGEGKGMDGFYIPFIYFAVPQGNPNFYIFTYDSPPRSDYYWEWDKVYAPKSFIEVVYGPHHPSWDIWTYAVANDRFMSPYMSGYRIDDGATVRSFLSGTDAGWDGTEWDIYMASVSEAAHNYYRALIEQFYQDGGAFSQAPASPPSNISNGGQGFFMATSVSTIRTPKMERVY